MRRRHSTHLEELHDVQRGRLRGAWGVVNPPRASPPPRAAHQICVAPFASRVVGSAARALPTRHERATFLSGGKTSRASPLEMRASCAVLYASHGPCGRGGAWANTASPYPDTPGLLLLLPRWSPPPREPPREPPRGTPPTPPRRQFYNLADTYSRRFEELYAKVGRKGETDENSDTETAKRDGAKREGEKRRGN